MKFILGRCRAHMGNIRCQEEDNAVFIGISLILFTLSRFKLHSLGGATVYSVVYLLHFGHVMLFCILFYCSSLAL